MDLINTDMLQTYRREVNAHRNKLALCFFVISILALAVVYVMPRPYTSSATIYVDDSNILRPLMAGAAITTDIVDQARLAQEILFKREFNNEVLLSAGYDFNAMSELEKEDLIDGIKEDTIIANEFFGTANLVRISNTSSNPVEAFNLAQKYTSLFIEQSIINKQEESRDAFDFIQKEAESYLEQLLIAEARLTAFRSENNEGSLVDANNRVARYNERIETLELEFFQLETEQASIESVLAGEIEVVRDLSEANNIRARINSLQINLDNLRAVYHETYPDIVQINAQIADLVVLLETEQSGVGFLPNEATRNTGTGTARSLEQELRSQLAAIQTSIESNATQVNAFKDLLSNEQSRLSRIMGTEAELTELTRDYTITQQFYNDMLSRMENARVSMHLDEEQQGITFKIQEPAVVALEADGINFYQLVIASFIFALGVPFGLLIMYVELDSRIRTESEWSAEWPPLLMIIPPLQSLRKRQMSDTAFLMFIAMFGIALYVGAVYLKMGNYNPETLLEMF